LDPGEADGGSEGCPALEGAATASAHGLWLKTLPSKLDLFDDAATTESDIIGLFVSASIPSGGTPEEVCDAIHAMGGLTYACHPLDRRRASFTPERLVELAPRFDIIETHNGRADPASNRAAIEACRSLGKVAATGSDAHSPRELGTSWMEIEPYEGAADFLRKLAAARHVIMERSGTGRRG